MVVVETMMVMLTSSVSFGGTLLIHQKTLRPCLSNNVSAFSQATTPIYIEIVREIGNRLDILLLATNLVKRFTVTGLVLGVTAMSTIWTVDQALFRRS